MPKANRWICKSMFSTSCLIVINKKPDLEGENRPIHAGRRDATAIDRPSQRITSEIAITSKARLNPSLTSWVVLNVVN